MCIPISRNVRDCLTLFFVRNPSENVTVPFAPLSVITITPWYLTVHQMPAFLLVHFVQSLFVYFVIKGIHADSLGTVRIKN
jgi:hypothetical protein